MKQHVIQPAATIIGECRRILIGSPTGDTMLVPTAQALNGLLLYMQGRGFNVGSGQAIGTYVDMNQNDLVATAIDQKTDALMLVDSDMHFPMNIVERLLARNKPIVGCVYRARRAPHDFMGRRLDGGAIDENAQGCAEMDYIPSGMMLIRSYVLRQMAYPWFFLTYGDKHADFVGNDVNFCRKARSAGFKVWCDFDASFDVSHIASVPIGWAA